MPAKPRVLCVDDEPHVLEGLALSLRRGFEVVSASGGEAALDVLRRDPAVATVVSDMRMPGMDGATLLSEAYRVAPDVTRMLLTGHADLGAAIAAINGGRVFRFLTKPCPPADLVRAVEAAVEQHRLVTAERVLLEQTLRGSIQMLMDILALAAPVAFGRAMRIRRYAQEMASRASPGDTWAIEMAAMFSQIGCIALPPGTLEKLDAGGGLTAEEQQALDRLPAFAEERIAALPRLDAVRAALKWQACRFDGVGSASNSPRGKDLPLGSRALRIAIDFDRLEVAGMSSPLALDTMRGRRGCYDPELLEAFATVMGGRAQATEVVELPLRAVRIGMVFVEDVRTVAGTLLIARGHEVTPSLVERIRNFAPGSVREPVRATTTRPAEVASKAVAR